TVSGAKVGVSENMTGGVDTPVAGADVFESAMTFVGKEDGITEVSIVEGGVIDAIASDTIIARMPVIVPATQPTPCHQGCDKSSNTFAIVFGLPVFAIIINPGNIPVQGNIIMALYI